MKLLVCLLLVHFSFSTFAQNVADNRLNQLSKMKINPDSVLIENLVQFNTTETVKSIDFTLKITNKGNVPIPDLGVTNRMEQVHFFINEKEVYLQGLGNGKETIVGDKTIKQNSSQTFTQSEVYSNNFLQTYGYLFIVQWTYNGIKSPLVRVDLASQKAITVHPKPEILVDSAILKRPINNTNLKTVGDMLDWLNHWGKFEIDAYFNKEEHPNYVVSGETNAFLDGYTKILAKMGIDIVWDRDRLKAFIKKSKN